MYQVTLNMDIDDNKVLEAKMERLKLENGGVHCTSEQGSGLETKQGAESSEAKECHEIGRGGKMWL